MAGVLDMLRDMGWKVIEVDGMVALASIHRAVKVVLIRSDASPDEAGRVVDRLLMGSAPAPQHRR